MLNSNHLKVEQRKLLKAGEIGAQALAYTCSLVAPNVSLLEIAEAGERYIRERGGQPAFPVNISVNHHAAHYTPRFGDEQQVPKCALVKVDLGVHVDGYISDIARTIIVGGDAKMERLVEAAEAGLQAAIATIKAGIRVWDVSKAISKAIRRFGVRPIENLTGHSIEQFNLHSGISVPAVAHSANRMLSPRLQEHMVIAIEPFATYSPSPRVIDMRDILIFGFSKHRNPQDTALRQLFSQMKITYAQLPFASRWLATLVPPDQIDNTLSALRSEQCIHGYPVLGLPDNSLIAQAEHTVIVERDGCTVTTQNARIRE